MQGKIYNLLELQSMNINYTILKNVLVQKKNFTVVEFWLSARILINGKKLSFMMNLS